MLDMHLNAPVIFVPERYDQVENNEVLVVDLGNITIDSKLIEFDPARNYKTVNNPMMLYDAYNFILKDTQILGFEHLADYRIFQSEEMVPHHVKLFKDVTLKLNLYNNIEQKHPVHPNYEVNISLENMTITASDYIFQSMMRLKDKVLANMNPPPKQQERHNTTKSSIVSESKLIFDDTKEQDDDLTKKMKELNVLEFDNKQARKSLLIAEERKSLRSSMIK